MAYSPLKNLQGVMHLDWSHLCSRATLADPRNKAIGVFELPTWQHNKYHWALLVKWKSMLNQIDTLSKVHVQLAPLPVQQLYFGAFCWTALPLIRSSMSHTLHTLRIGTPSNSK